MAKKDDASKILTGHLTKILKEKHDVKVVKKGKEVTITKGEALARQMVDAALGYTETIDVCDKDGVVTDTRKVVHSPDVKLVKEVIDRVEGRAAAVGVKEDDSKPSIADRVSDEGKLQLNKIAKKSSLKI